MKISGAEFLAQPRKAVTLIGMSGVGKSHTADKLAGWGWHNYSCDTLIGTQYLADILGGATEEDNMAFLSAFVGKIGNEARGGLPLAEFQKRQKLYYDAECASLVDMAAALEQAEGHFVCDSSGSLCEVEDEGILEDVGARSVVVYLKVQQEGHAEILERAFKHPKPLYFPPAFLDERLAAYKEKFDLTAVEQIDPLEFLRWVFPHLFESRLPKYQRIADQYGVTLPSHVLSNAQSEGDFMQMVADALDGGVGE